MTSSGWVLLGFVILFWGALAAPLRRKSLFPVIPIIPAVAVLGGFLLNRWIDWLGTVAMLVLHVVLIAVVLIGNRRELFGRNTDKPDDAG